MPGAACLGSQPACPSAPPAAQVTSLHLDRLKVATATERFGEAPLRAWCARTGECLAELGSCLPAAEPAGPGEAAAPGDGEPGSGAAAEGQPLAALPEQWQEAEEEPTEARQYRRQWEGVTSLACRGALLVSGNTGGTVCERDYGRGGLPGGAQDAGVSGSSKFWAV